MNRFFSASLPIVALIIGVTICVLFVAPVRADVIYGQLVPTPPLGAFSSNDAGNVTDQKIADNFLVTGPGPVTIRSLRFIGAYGVNVPPPSTPPLNAQPTDDFRVVFFADSAGAPGVPLVGGDFHIGTKLQRTPTGGPKLNAVVTPLEYVVDLGAGISLSPTTIYWVSLVNNVGPNYGWAWARAAGVFDQQVAATYGDVMTGPWSTDTNGGMYFQLNNNNVPEPASIGMLLAAVSGILCFRVTHPS